MWRNNSMIVDKCDQKTHSYALLLPNKTSQGLFYIKSQEIHTLANSAQARKRARQADVHYARNAAQRSRFRTVLKKVVYAIDANDKATAEAAYKEAIPVIDRMANKGLIHKNKAARHKSRLNTKIQSL